MLTLKKLLYENIGKINDNNLEPLYHNTYRYNGTINTYHLSTNPDLNFNGTFKSERGGDGDYIYSSLDYKEWLKLFKDESLGEVPKYLYIIKITNPKYKPSYELFGKKTPSEFLSTKENTEIVKYVGEVN